MNIKQTLAQWFYSPGAYGLWVALDDVEHWDHWAGEVWEYRRDNKTIARLNGGSRWGLDGYERDTPKFLGRFERHFLWPKFKALRKRKKQLKREKARAQHAENNRHMLYVFTRLEEPR
jgi:hypothetical protein